MQQCSKYNLGFDMHDNELTILFLQRYGTVPIIDDLSEMSHYGSAIDTNKFIVYFQNEDLIKFIGDLKVGIEQRNEELQREKNPLLKQAYNEYKLLLTLIKE